MPRECLIDGCLRPHEAKGYCRLHYQQWRRENPDLPRCSVDGCEKVARAKELCVTHYTRLLRCGDPGDARRRQWQDWSADEDARLALVLDSRPDGLGRAGPGEIGELAMAINRTVGATTTRLCTLRRQRREEQNRQILGGGRFS